MFDHVESTAEFALLDAIADALRAEFAAGARIEEQPGFRDPSEAGQVNRAYRVVARTVLRSLAPLGPDLAPLLSRALAQFARRRLVAGGLDGRRADVLLNTEPGRDDWLTYFLLTPWDEIEHQGRGDDPGRDDDPPTPPA